MVGQEIKGEEVLMVVWYIEVVKWIIITVVVAVIVKQVYEIIFKGKKKKWS